MKKCSLFLLIVLCTCANTFAQYPYIYFTSPTQDQIVTGAGDGSHISVYVNYRHLASQQALSVKVKLFTDVGDFESPNIPSYISTTAGPKSWRLELHEWTLGGDYISARQTITFTVKYALFPSNIFSGGTMKLDLNPNPTPLVNGETHLKKSIGEHAYLEAVDQPASDGLNYTWSSEVQNPSFWSKKIVGGNPAPISDPRLLDYTVKVGDNFATLRAEMRKLFDISRSDLTEFDQTLSVGVIDHAVEATDKQLSNQPSQVINGRSYVHAGWNNNDGWVWNATGNTQVTALYKMLGKSNNSNAFTNNSQRRIVKTQGGNLFRTYESMGKVWVERSNDNGYSWTIANGGKPISPIDAKLPSLATFGEMVMVVWQERYDYYGNGYGTDDIYKIRLVVISGSSGLMIAPIANVEAQEDQGAADLGFELYSANTNPVVAWDVSGKLMVVWENKIRGNLLYRYGYVGASYSAITLYGEVPGAITGSDLNSFFPTIASYSSLQSPVPTFHIAWQQNYSSIKYCTIGITNANDLIFSAIETPSNGCILTKNGKPSITVVNGSPKLVWRAFDPDVEYAAMFRYKSGTTWSGFYSYSDIDNLESPNIASSGNGTFVIVYSELWGNYTKCVKSTNLSTNNLLGLQGTYVQVSNSYNNDYSAAVFKNTAIPYYFSNASVSTAQSGNLDKEVETEKTYFGRSISAANEKSSFYYALDNVSVDGETIGFAEDMISEASGSLHKNIIKTTPFVINGGTTLSFSVSYGKVDNSEIQDSLNEGQIFQSKVELVDALTGEVLHTFVPISQTGKGSKDKQTLSFTFNGNEQRNVELRIVEQDNLGREYIITNIHGDGRVLEKAKNTELVLGNGAEVTTYALDQNYPNPFNPSTVIRYQIPEAGRVTLKVFDVLGREVASLVDEFMEKGRYEASFNASALSSGTYIYKIQVNNYSSTKKMMLVK